VIIVEPLQEFTLMGVEYDISLLGTLLCWHFTVSVVVIQQFVESVTCLILCHIHRK